jgi:hypothetical protein
MKSVLFIIVSCIIYQSAITQEISIFSKTLDAWRNDYPQEKVFLQTDKSYYNTGDIIWIKAWCATTEGPTYLSKIIYIDLVDEKGNVRLKKMYQLDSLGATAADFEIPANLPAGNYSLNGYTLWMLNFPEFISQKNVYIYSSGNTHNLNLNQLKRNKLLIEFFPEGGHLIAGNENRIAFKATDNYGSPVTCKGHISDNSGKKIIDFETEHDGMGSFEFMVEPGKKYTAVVEAANAALNYLLPEPREEGISLKVTGNPGRIFALIHRGEKNKEAYSKLTVVAQLNYTVVHTSILDIDQGQTAVSISKKNLPPGIMQITVFDENKRPLAERIVFVENYQLVSPDIKMELTNFSAKGKNRLNFSLDSVSASSVSCLITAYDSSLNYQENIASYLLLGSEIKGNINRPSYYLKDKSATTLKHLDLLLMTQGWRRYRWEKLIAGEKIPLKYAVESAISFRGTVFKSDRKDPVTEGKVSFIIHGIDSTSILAEAGLTDKGEFLLSDINYKKKAEVAYMGTNNKKENFIVDVKMTPNYIDSLSKSAFTPSLNLDTLSRAGQHSQLLAYLKAGANDSSQFKVLTGVTVRARKMDRLDSLNSEYATGVFQMGKSVDPSAFPQYSSVWQMLLAAVPGITIEGNPFDPMVSFNRFGGQRIVSPVDVTSETGGTDISVPSVVEETGIAYFLNEVNVSKDVINTLAVDDIAFIKVLKNEAAALGASQGAIAFYTKTGTNISARPYDKSYTRQNFEGYAIHKEFFSPDYSQHATKSGDDNRFTLFWSGSIRPAKDGKYRFEFYNNDTNKKFYCLIQGIDADGQLILKEIAID